MENLEKKIVEILGKKININKIQNPVLKTILNERVKEINGEYVFLGLFKGNSYSDEKHDYEEEGYYTEYSDYTETNMGYTAENFDIDSYTEHRGEYVKKKIRYSLNLDENPYKHDQYSEYDDKWNLSREGMGYCEE
jgi:hypothetical protein